MRTISRGSPGWQSVRSTLRDGLFRFDSKGRLVPIPSEQGWGDLLKLGRKRGGLSSGDAEKLRGIMCASFSRPAYKDARQHWPFFFSPDPRCDDDENFGQYRVQWLSSMLADIRVGMIDPSHLSATDWEEVSRIVKTFLRVAEGPQRKIIRQFSDLRIPLREIAKSGRLPALILSDAARYALQQTLSRRGRDAADALTKLGCDYWSPLSPLDAYEQDPVEFSRELYRLRGKVAPRRSPLRKSPPASS